MQVVSLAKILREKAVRDTHPIVWHAFLAMWIVNVYPMSGFTSVASEQWLAQSVKAHLIEGQEHYNTTFHIMLKADTGQLIVK